MMQLHNCKDQPTFSHHINSSVCFQSFALHTASYCLPPQLRTMQFTTTELNRNSLILTLTRYSSAVSDMERTILLPSLLRDVPSDCEAAKETCRDLYANYLMLKAVRNTVENSLVLLDDHKAKNMALAKSPDSVADADPEAVFLFHLRGMFSVMSELTKKTKSLTEKYLDIIGVAD
ncbi:mid1-interacting protein 1-B-like [Nothobranchius furzeri]|uniref:Mid1-interacting protein 1-B-like n=2 Tax=Nothobranchius furzeri TaxID=105023 RepID=A0A9D2YDC1_NOTFU|nr:mid1-interacting protein 1-B-like [Nothobranchius furzeri]